jgi:uncharacterized membrane protein
MSQRQLAVLLICFDEVKAAGGARRALDEQLRADGALVLDQVVFEVRGKPGAAHKVSVHDHHRDVVGTLTSALTWGCFGLATSGDVTGAVVWALLGAVCGGGFAYLTEHLLTKDELARLGARLPADTSALATWVETSDPGHVLEAAAALGPSVASVAVIADDLSARVLAGDSNPVDVPVGDPHQPPAPDQAAVLSMILVRYPEPETARQIAAKRGVGSPPSASQVELVFRCDADGRRHVASPKQGVAAMSKSDVISWGGFGVVFGAIAGLTGGGGLLGFLEDGVVTGVAWALFGLVAGALYGLWAGRAVSARRLESVGPLLAPGTSVLLAWSDGPTDDAELSALAAPGSQRVVLRFNTVEGGALLEAT